MRASRHSGVKELPASAGDVSCSLGLKDLPEEEMKKPIPIFCYENSRGACWGAFMGLQRVETRLNDLTLLLNQYSYNGY